MNLKKIPLIIISILLLIAIVIALPFFAIRHRDAKTIQNLAELLRAGAIDDITPSQMDRFSNIQTGILAKMDMMEDEMAALQAAYKDRLAETLEDPQPPDQRRMEQLLNLQSFSKPNLDAKAEWQGDLKEALDAELAFVASWREHNIEIRITRDLKKRLAVIRSAVSDHQFANQPDSPLCLRARRHLMGQLIEAATTLEANPDAESVLADALPSTGDFEAIQIPLALIHQRLQSLPLNEFKDKQRWQTFSDGLEKIRKRTAERAFLMERVINDMLQGLAPQERQDLLTHGLTVMKNHYLFDLSDRAWPEGVKSLPAILLPAVEQHHGPSGQVVRRLCRDPIYAAELETVKAVAAVRVYQTELLEALKEILDKIADNEWQNIDIQELENLKQRIDELTPQDKPHLKQWLAFFEKQKTDLGWLKPLVKRWVHHNIPMERAEVLKRLKDHFETLCREANR